MEENFEGCKNFEEAKNAFGFLLNHWIAIFKTNSKIDKLEMNCDFLENETKIRNFNYQISSKLISNPSRKPGAATISSGAISKTLSSSVL